ncbi:MAG: ankyrin repeat domain-containing protein [Verrucomicrobiales bacterium]|nr:ankyrin repeat domain-containing protein [Verrucomicrobiales bacterium]
MKIPPRFALPVLVFSVFLGIWISGRFEHGLASQVSTGQGNADFPKQVGHPPFLSPHASPIKVHGDRVFVVNTPADTVDVIDTVKKEIVRRVPVGIDPVSIAVRPDGKEIWVANHISDSVSVIDNDPKSPTWLQVIATVQDIDPVSKATRFDEPVGIAFAGNHKAYVALSSENEIAVIDVPSRRVVKRLAIAAQDPRAIKVRGERLYVIPFESNNQTQLSGGRKEDIDGELVTFDIWEHSVHHNNVLSLGHVTDIVKHPRVPDRDLYVFDTRTDQLVETVDTLGTLLYGLAVDSKGSVFVAQTDARNEVNGRAGTKKHGLAELENRAFLNRITKVPSGGEGRQAEFFELEPLPPVHPDPDEALATPFAIQVSDDDAILVATAAGSDQVFTVDADSGEVLGRAQVEAVPRGIALESDVKGRASRAWVFNAVANSVSLVDLSDPTSLQAEATVVLEDPTPPVFKRGRIAFNTAKASTTRTFSCASCHPDGHTDQLLWVLDTPIVTGADQIMPRSTMPIRGLRDTAPFHWDGIPGDPYGGSNSANVRGHVDPNASLGDPESTTRHLIDGGLASTMKRVGDETANDEGKAGSLWAAERDDMAKFLLHVTYPPAQKRSYTNELSDRAEEGFELFHVIGNEEGGPQRNVCGSCHRMPFWVSTNTPGSGMDTPTWRGAYDRFLILPQGRLNVIDLEFYERIAEQGIPEREMWRLSWRSKSEFDPVWDMVLEGSTGYSGSFARQVTLNQATSSDRQALDLLVALEASAAEGGIVLQGEGVVLENEGESRAAVTLQFDGAAYVSLNGEDKRFTREQLVSLAFNGKFVGTFTGRHGENADYTHPQPALWTLGPIHAQRGKQEFPVLSGESKTMTISGRHLREGARVIVNGRAVDASVALGDKERVEIALDALPAPGIHFLQVQNPDGLFSNDFIFHVAAGEAEAQKLSAAPDRLRRELGSAISSGEVDEVRRLVHEGAALDRRHPDNGMTPLGDAAFNGELEILRFLLNRGVDASYPNRDGNTALHTAAFLCRREMVEQLLERGASIERKNDRGETPIDVVSGDWSEELSRFYRYLDKLGNLDLDLGDIRKSRLEISQLLLNHRDKGAGSRP